MPARAGDDARANQQANRVAILEALHRVDAVPAVSSITRSTIPRRFWESAQTAKDARLTHMRCMITAGLRIFAFLSPLRFDQAKTSIRWRSRADSNRQPNHRSVQLSYATEIAPQDNIPLGCNLCFTNLPRGRGHGHQEHLRQGLQLVFGAYAEMKNRSCVRLNAIFSAH